MTDHDAPFWTSLWLVILVRWYDAIAKPSLSGLAIISSATAVVGYASQFDNPDFAIFMRCAALGFALWLIARTFWAGAWLLPALETKKPLQVYVVVASLGFSGFAIPSVLGSLSANGGGISVSVTQQENIDRIDNTRQDFVLYIEALPLIELALEDRAKQARTFEADEIAGRGPTGVLGVGSVSNSFGASADLYDQAADILGQASRRAAAHITALDGIMEELRAAQIDPELVSAEKDARLKLLSGQAIGEMRALLALDPARAVRAAADKIAVGVPQRSNARATSQARIAEISAGMAAHAGELRREADRLEAMAPVLPQQITLSPAERIMETMWRMPGLTMAALLFDLCGWIAVGFRVAIYQALKSKLREEASADNPAFVRLEDFDRVEHYVKRAQESRERIDAAKAPPKRGRPKGSTNSKSPRKRTTKSTGKGAK